MKSDNDSDVDPSWAEVRNFIQFLNSQLHDCERSPYCLDPGFTSAGLKEFVVKFAILMAKVNGIKQSFSIIYITVIIL